MVSIFRLPQDIMHALPEGTIQYELRILLLHYMHTNYFLLQDTSSGIVTHEYSCTEINDKPTSLHESVFNGNEKYKLKYNADQTRVFLRLVSFFVLEYLDVNDDYYIFLTQVIEICHYLHQQYQIKQLNN